MDKSKYTVGTTIENKTEIQGNKMTGPKGIAQNGTTRYIKKSLVKHSGKGSLLQETMYKVCQYHGWTPSGISGEQKRFKHFLAGKMFRGGYVYNYNIH